MRNTKLLISGITKFLAGLVLVILLIFLPTGDLGYINGWILTAILFVPMLVAGIIMWLKKPELLSRRLNAKEKQDGQRTVIAVSAVMFISGFVISGLCVKYDFLVLPLWMSLIFTAVFIAGYILYGIVISQNEYLSRTIEVSDSQKVIDTGIYSVVRHPMYLATILMFMSMPLILGSVMGFLVFLAYPFIIAYRIKKEEEFLSENLSGYSDYIKKVKYRMIPKIW